ncbi:MAG TPA: type II toxin-antitoxin system PemK/MazF family toxin [Chloroflexota bacterium]|jgi:mRNA interferase MazF|nr:type II toxin-antitoxin system PemK/MazF family toxin [Chloroflexota bacterium]
MPTTDTRSSPRRGEVWTVALLRDPHSPRPCLVISENTRNQYAPNLLVVPIFSSAPQGPTRVALRAGQGGVLHDSVLMCDQLITVLRDDLVRGPLGQPVPVSILKAVVLAIRIAVGDPTV